ncbi:hypothetical protein EV644_1548 [Kribbella orskensis]|uniref:Uncharacterized protein n=1 Tax=Kribbella orskensis TaxID=2512216 RepID=A0ABY2B5P9_9ACTN|nr:hypothetical protein EV642_1568 [Kribbella sp. VKM Ac-2500]TCO07586.1 hypothetical protein EV644_1548 [Kribbella orskensis]
MRIWLCRIGLVDADRLIAGLRIRGKSICKAVEDVPGHGPSRM